MDECCAVWNHRTWMRLACRWMHRRESDAIHRAHMGRFSTLCFCARLRVCAHLCCRQTATHIAKHSNKPVDRGTWTQHPRMEEKVAQLFAALEGRDAARVGELLAANADLAFAWNDQVRVSFLPPLPHSLHSPPFLLRRV